MDFIVLDTEGRRELKEIAIVNCLGQLIYEAFNQEHPDYTEQSTLGKPLKTILLDFRAIASNKIAVFHKADHDLEVLKNSCQKTNLPWQKLSKVDCTYKMARQFFPNSQYSLEYLAKKLNLKVDRQYFNLRQAHVARYDAQFTYQLYLAIKQKQKMTSTPRQINPFSSSRVDNPFQVHPDNPQTYSAQSLILESVIDDLKYDQNHQSKGAVIIGQPGTGKTHLIMRLAQKRLKLNPLLFIPCPNDANTIKYHTYSYILESLNKPIPGTGFNQLESFLANTFVGIIKSTNANTQKINGILSKIENDPLKLYEILGGEDTQTRRNNWDYVEKFTSDWWLQQYGAAGYAPEIIRGIVKFCRYSDSSYKQLLKKWLAADELEPEELDKIGLSSWHDEISKEDFSLDAIAVVGKLSLLHEPLIMVFDQLEMLGLEHNKAILLNFGEAVKEIFTRVPHSLIIFNLFPDRWQKLQQTFDGSIIDRISQHQVLLEPPTILEIEQILQRKAEAVGSNLASLFTSQELERIIGEGRSVRTVLNRAGEFFRYKFQNIPLSPDRPKDRVGSLDNLTGSDNQLNQSEIISRLDKLESQQNRLEQLLANIGKAFTQFVVREPITSLELSLEEKVAEYLKIQREELELDYQDTEILLDEKDVGKLQDIIEAFKQIIPSEIETDIFPTKRALPPHRIINQKNICIGFLSDCKGSKFTARIQNFNEFVATKEHMRFILWRDVRGDVIKPKTVGEREIVKLNATKNGEFKLFDRDNRLTFELIYRFISDIYNQDLAIDLDTEFITALKIIAGQFQHYWLVRELQ